MGRDPRSEDDGDAPLDVSAAIRAAKTAAAHGRAPEPQATAKIGAFDLDEALAKSRDAGGDGEGAKLEDIPDPPVHAEPPPVAAPPAVDAVEPAPMSAGERPSGLQKLREELMAPVAPPKDLYRPKEDADKSTAYQTWLFILLFMICLVIAVWFVRSL